MAKKRVNFWDGEKGKYATGILEKGWVKTADGRKIKAEDAVEMVESPYFEKIKKRGYGKE